MAQEYRLADSVLHRIVQAVQEGMLLGVDISDIMRQIRVVVDEEDPTQVVMSQAYREMVKQHHDKLEAEAKTLREAQEAANIITVTGGGDGVPN